MRIVAMSCVALSIACNTSKPKPAEMSVEEHRRAAEVHEAEAEEHARKFDPTAVAQRPRQVVIATPEAGFYNPTLRDKMAAERHERKAEEHLERAAELARAEQVACAESSRSQKVTCPVVGPLRSVVKGRDGVVVTFVDPTRRDAVLQQLRCHVAYADAEGLHDENLCALDVVGLTVEAEGDGILFKTRKRSELDGVFTFLQAQSAQPRRP